MGFLTAPGDRRICLRCIRGSILLYPAFWSSSFAGNRRLFLQSLLIRFEFLCKFRRSRSACPFPPLVCQRIFSTDHTWLSVPALFHSDCPALGHRLPSHTSSRMHRRT